MLPEFPLPTASTRTQAPAWVRWPLLMSWLMLWVLSLAGCGDPATWLASSETDKPEQTAPLANQTEEPMEEDLGAPTPATSDVDQTAGLGFYVLTHDDIKRLELNPQVQELLFELSQQGFSSETALQQAVTEALAKIDGLPETLKADYLAYAMEHLTSYEAYWVTLNSIDQLKIAGFSLALIEPIENYVGQAFRAESALHQALNSALKTQITEASKQGASKKQTEQSTQEAINLLLFISEHLYLGPVYRLDGPAFSSQAFPGLSEKKTQCLDLLANQQFPRRLSMHQAVQRLLKRYQAKAAGNGSKLACETDPKDASEQASDLTKDVRMVVNLAHKPYAPSRLVIEPIAIEGAPDCGCVEPMKGDVYGFYPYWLAANSLSSLAMLQPEKLSLDFSTLSRLAYFAIPFLTNDDLTADQEASFHLDTRLHLKKAATMASLVEQTEKYNAELDIVLYSNNWQYWRADQINKLAVDSLAVLTETNALLEKPLAFSGIIVYFDHYRIDSKRASIINRYMVALKNLAQTAGLAVRVSLMLGIQWDEEDLYSCEVGDVDDADKSYISPVKDIFLQQASDAPPSRLFLHLTEPTTKTKKCLRQHIENELHGNDRRDLLRSVVPILSRIALPEDNALVSGKIDKFSQFHDDLTYFEDNFAGIGFWPTAATPWSQGEPIKDEDSSNPGPIQTAQRIHTELISSYINIAEQSALAKLLESQVPEVCVLICPNRVLAETLWWLMLLATLLALIGFNTHCQTRRLILAHKQKLLMAALALVGYSLAILGCVPYLDEYSDQLLLIILLIIIILVIYYAYLNDHSDDYL